MLCMPQALHICIALLERRQPPESSNQGEEALRQSVERAAAATAELNSKLEGDTVEGICQHTDRLAALLDSPPQRSQLVSIIPYLHEVSSTCNSCCCMFCLWSTAGGQNCKAHLHAYRLPGCPPRKPPTKSAAGEHHTVFESAVIHLQKWLLHN